MLWNNGSKAPWHKFHLTKGRQSSSYMTSLNNLLVQFAKQSTCWSCCCERRHNVRPSFSERVAYFPNELLNFERSISFPFLIGSATTFYTFWDIDSRPILQNGMSNVLLAVVVPLLCLRLSGAILMLMTITTIMMITREKLVSIITICCSNLSFLARHRPAEPCPLCSTKHNAICHRLFCKICYLDNLCIFCAYTTIFLVTVFKAQHRLLIHLNDIPLTLNMSLKAKKKPNFGSSFIFFLSKMN